MPRRDRRDGPGTIHHVMNRGLSRRTIFRDKTDWRFFLALLAWEVKRGFLRVYAFVLMDNHYHLLVESRVGSLSAAMHRIHSRYVRRFNRRMDRDGPLFRSRFKSIPVEDNRYWDMLTSYIEQNPVVAGLAPSAEDYPYGSAYYRTTPKAPRWLADSLSGPFPNAFSREVTSDEAWMIERVLQAQHPPALHWTGPNNEQEVSSWVAKRARIADGNATIPPAAAPRTVIEISRRRQEQHTTLLLRRKRRGKPGWTILQVGLLRTLCCLRFDEISEMLEIPCSTARNYSMNHAVLLETEPEYAIQCGAVASEAIRRLLPGEH